MSWLACFRVDPKRGEKRLTGGKKSVEGVPWRSQVNDAYLSFPVTCCCADAQAHGAAIIYAAPQAETVNSVAAWKQKVDEALDGQLPTIAIANKVRSYARVCVSAAHLTAKWRVCCWPFVESPIRVLSPPHSRPNPCRCAQCDLEHEEMSPDASQAFESDMGLAGHFYASAKDGTGPLPSLPPSPVDVMCDGVA